MLAYDEGWAPPTRQGSTADARAHPVAEVQAGQAAEVEGRPAAEVEALPSALQGSATGARARPAAEMQPGSTAETRARPATEVRAGSAAEVEALPATRQASIADAQALPATEARARLAAEVRAGPVAEARARLAAEVQAGPVAEVRAGSAGEVRAGLVAEVEALPVTRQASIAEGRLRLGVEGPSRGTADRAAADGAAVDGTPADGTAADGAAAEGAAADRAVGRVAEEEVRPGRASRGVVVVAAVTAAVGVPVMVLAAVVVLPNTVAAVLPEALDDLGVSDARLVASAFGASLPAAAAAVPVAAAAARRLSPAMVLVAGLLLLAAAHLAGGLTGGVAGDPARGQAILTLIVGVRVLLGIGAGTVLAGLLLYVARLPGCARRLLGGWYAGVLLAAMIVAPALAVPPDWRMLLRPFPALVGPGLALCAVLLWTQNRLPRTGRPPSRAERALGTLPLLPALGMALLAYASTLGWPPPARLTAGVIASAAMLLLGYAGAADRSAARAAAAPAAAMTGILVFPTISVVSGALLGYGPDALVWGVLVAAAGTALGAGAVAGALPGRMTAFAGYVLVIAGMALLYAGLNPAPATPLPPGPLPIAAGTVLFAAGLGTALGAGLAGTRGPAAAYALALLLPGTIAGLMLSTAIYASVPTPGPLWPIVAAGVAAVTAPGLVAGTGRVPG